MAATPAQDEPPDVPAPAVASNHNHDNASAGDVPHKPADGDGAATAEPEEVVGAAADAAPALVKHVRFDDVINLEDELAGVGPRRPPPPGRQRRTPTRRAPDWFSQRGTVTDFTYARMRYRRWLLAVVFLLVAAGVALLCLALAASTQYSWSRRYHSPAAAGLSFTVTVWAATAVDLTAAALAGVLWARDALVDGRCCWAWPPVLAWLSVAVHGVGVAVAAAKLTENFSDPDESAVAVVVLMAVGACVCAVGAVVSVALLARTSVACCALVAQRRKLRLRRPRHKPGMEWLAEETEADRQRRKRAIAKRKKKRRRRSSGRHAQVSPRYVDGVASDSERDTESEGTGMAQWMPGSDATVGHTAAAGWGNYDGGWGGDAEWGPDAQHGWDASAWPTHGNQAFFHSAVAPAPTVGATASPHAPVAPQPAPQRVAGPLPWPADDKVTPTVFETLWQATPVAGRFSVHIRMLPTVTDICEHLRACGFRPIAQGRVQDDGGGSGGVMKVFFTASQRAGLQWTTFLAEFVVVEVDKVLHATMKCSEPSLLASFVRRFQLAQLFLPIDGRL